MNNPSGQYSQEPETPRPEVPSGGGRETGPRLLRLAVIITVIVLLLTHILRQHPGEPAEGMPTPPSRMDDSRSKSLRSTILQLRGWDFEPGSVGEHLLKFIENGAPDYSRTALVFKNIDFSADTLIGLSLSQRKELDDLARVLVAFPDIRVEIGAHSDQSRDLLLGYTLSRREVEVIKRYLLQKGVPADQLETRAYGFDFPLTDNISDEAKAQNRRVELLILKMGLTAPGGETTADTSSFGR
jgi:OOP family OmpA-OmpF porin